jgi:murein DD-endopeptidase MepM/ murein hydrolase activator NlpD
MPRARTVIAGAIITVLLAATLIGLFIRGEVTKACNQTTTFVLPASSTQVGSAKQFNDPDQRANAKTIMGVGEGRNLSRRDLKIALMVAMQESHLRNLPGGDRDSLGLFQQRPSQGWGTPSQIMDPVYASNKFYDALEKVKNRNSMSLLDVALAVQRPSKAAYLSKDNYFPGWEPAADAFLGGAPSGSSGQLVAAPAMMPAQECAKLNVSDAEIAVQAALSQQGKPYRFSDGAGGSFDVSGLMQWAYDKAGITLPSGALALYQRGAFVAGSAGTSGDAAAWQKVLQRGDLLFWGSNPADSKTISHVAMYLGDGKQIDAPQTGATISIKPVPWKLGSLSFVGATRPAPGSPNLQAIKYDGWVFPLKSITVTSPFGMRFHPVLHKWLLHDGVDFAASEGTPVYAAQNGVVIAPYGHGYGLMLNLDHGGGIGTAYAHLSSYAPGIGIGSHVKAGQLVAYSGSTGWVTGPHLHFIVRVNGTPVNPLDFYRARGLVP